MTIKFIYELKFSKRATSILSQQNTEYENLLVKEKYSFGITQELYIFQYCNSCKCVQQYICFLCNRHIFIIK